MSKEEFMKELEYLLSDIPDEDKKDGLDYYRDYLDEAGDMAGKAIEEFGSPERIAAIIRSDIRGDLGDGGAFTERGYEDERFRDPNYQVVKRHDLPDINEDSDSRQAGGGNENREAWSSRESTEGQGGWSSKSSTEDQSGWSSQAGADKRRGGFDGTGTQGGQSRPLGSGPQGRMVKIVLFAVLAIIAFPALLGIGGGILGVAAGVISVFFAVLVVLAVLTFALILAGILLCVAGVIAMFTSLLDGLFCFGAGLLVLSFGLICLVISAWFYGRLVPWMIRVCVNGIGSLIHRKERRA